MTEKVRLPGGLRRHLRRSLGFGRSIWPCEGQIFLYLGSQILVYGL